MRVPPLLQAAMLVLFIAVSLLIMNWDGLISWILTTQQQLHVMLRTHVSAVSQQPWQHGWLLIAAAFGYGVFHAIGPGHGKALVASYLGTQTSEGFKQGIMLSFLGSILQSLMAIGVVSVFVLVLSVSVSKVTQQDWVLEAVSFTLVALLGAVMLLRALWQKYTERKAAKVELSQFSFQPVIEPGGSSLTLSAGPTHQHSHSCGCQHHVTVEHSVSWKEKLLLICAMGFRPCSGALIVLVYAHLVGVYSFGVAAVLAMGIGTGIAVAALAVVVVTCRKWFQTTLSRSTSGLPIDGAFWLKLIGGVLLLLLGLSLLTSLNMAPPSRPIL